MSAQVITIAQQKGGAGKTTLAAHLAVALAGLKKKVVAVDIDPQGSLSNWFEMRDEGADNPEIRTVTGWRVSTEVDRLRRDFDYVVIDSPPHAETDAKTAIRVADIVVIPVQPSPMDLWATSATVHAAASEKTDALVVLNRVPPRANLADLITGKVKELGLPVAKTTLGNRVALAAAMMEGKGITEHRSSSTAAKEIKALVKEIQKRLG
ncbi:MAG: ParA family protein [Alphaproteobacteria bacterium]|nr:ParA family protein [Alphaproteobacteria bacterium]